MAERRDLMGVTAFAVAGLVLALIAAGGPAQALVGIPFALFVPGYAVVAALFPPRTLGSVERAVASVAAALAVLVLSGIALDALGVRLEADSFAVVLASVTLVAATVAYGRGRALAGGTDRAGARLWLVGGATLMTVIAVIALAFSLTESPRSARGVAGYAALSGSRDGQAVTFAVENAEPRMSTYRIVMTRGAAQLYADSVTLRPGTRWTSTLTAPGPGTVTVTLYAGARTTPIRTLTLPL